MSGTRLDRYTAVRTQQRRAPAEWAPDPSRPPARPATAPFQRHRLRLAARVLRHGGVVAYPTEAVFGLGCNPWNREAVERILAIKGRSPSKGLILIAAEAIQLAPFVAPLPRERMAEILGSWPGPNTWVLPAAPGVPPWLTGRFDTIAVRVSHHPLAAGLCRAFGGALVSTSANRSGRAPARTLLALRQALGTPAPGTVDYVLPGSCGGADRPSCIRDGQTGRVLRA